MQALKLVMIGPIGSGKTTIGNFLADATDIPFEYHPTQGARILEFEVQSINVKNKSVSKDIELWDCSGDHKFKSCWPAMRRDAQGFIIVYSAKSKDCVKQLQEFYDYFVNEIKLGPDNCVIFCYDPDNSISEISKVVSSTFPKVSHVRCNVENGGKELKTNFYSFLSTLMTKMQEYVDEKEKVILSDNILFAK